MPGQNNSLPPIAIGSHLDTQPTGGKYDGILGVISGIEVMKVLNRELDERGGSSLSTMYARLRCLGGAVHC
jgi:acetylornithine deacetylase/succinyl-diaminopimelate desuccinylase-like protein